MTSQPVVNIILLALYFHVLIVTLIPTEWYPSVIISKKWILNKKKGHSALKIKRHSPELLVTYIVGCVGVVQLGGSDPLYNHSGPAKMGACKYFLFTESSVVVKIKNT